MNFPVARRAELSRRLFWLSFLTLIAVQLADIAVEQPPWIICLGKLLPLLIFIPGLLQGRLKTYMWLCFVVLVYFISLVLRLFADPEEARHIIGMVAVVVLFNAGMMYVRWQAQAMRAEADATGISP